MKLYINSEHLNQPANDIIIQFHETMTGYKHIRLLECKLYNSWYNITKENNRFNFTVDKKPSVKVLEEGNYNIESLVQAIGRAKMINFKRVHATSKTLMILEEKYKIDFTKPNNFAKLLGFEENVYNKTQISQHRANFLPVSEYVVHCDIIDSPTNYINGKRADYLQILTLRDTNEICEKVTYSYPNSISVPIKHTSLNSIKIWITDQNGSNIDFHGYPISYQLELL